MQSLTEHEKKILEMVKCYPEIVGDRKAREKVATEFGITEKTLRNRIADLKRYGMIDKKNNILKRGEIGKISSSHDADLLVFLKVILRGRKLVLTNFIITSVLAVIVSLLLPKTFRSATVIMPPISHQDLGLLSNISNIPFAGLAFGSGDTESMVFLAIVRSRTVMENVVEEFGLIDFYNVKNMEEAVKILRDNTIFDIEDEGTISISADVTTSWLSNDKEDSLTKQLCTDIANTFVLELDFINKKLKTEQARFQRLFIEKRYHQNIEDLKYAEENLKVFQEVKKMIALPQQTSVAIEAAANIKAQILIDEVKLGVISETLSPNHPEVEILKREIEGLNSQLKEMETGESGNYLFPRFSEVPELAVQVARLTRDVEIQNTLFTFLTQQYEEAKIKEAKDTPTVQVLDRAVQPEKKYKPKRAIFVIFYGFLSIVFTSMYIIFKPGFVATYKALQK